MLDFWGELLDVVGKIMVAYTAVMVHYRFWKEHRIDDRVFSTMRRERTAGLVGIILIVVGFLLRLPGLL